MMKTRDDREIDRAEANSLDPTDLKNVYYGEKQFGSDSYKGYLKNDQPDGEGTYTWGASTDTYFGNFVNGKRAGYGMYQTANGTAFFGQFADNFTSGWGLISIRQRECLHGRMEW